ncbi:DUF2252 domain-containing protein (plasmid) [Novosphingobium sp. BL-8A]|uniref:DUF2252 domain-containing protein n=1 Tax=Novosphingobium sp. BL-8A TaxID=3127639 RepID=UPI00375768FE
MLEQQNATRIRELVPVRYGRMLASPFSFLRGAAVVMARDLSFTSRTGIDVMACGDMHTSNFGLFASAERNLVFAINDFDEVHPAPWEWDLKRLVSSAALLARGLGGRRGDRDAAVRAASSSYRRDIRRYAEMGFLQVWYDSIDERSILAAAPAGVRRSAEEALSRARTRGHMRALDRLTEEVGGQRRIVEEWPLIVREDTVDGVMPIQAALNEMLRTYIASLPEERRFLLERYRIVDVARKTVGVGSVGTSCWVILLEGLNGYDPLFLQVKEASASVLAPFAKTQLSMENQGQRVVIGQRLTQGSPDIFLGWGQVVADRWFYVRQLADMKGGARFAEGDHSSLAGLSSYCGLCGWALAQAHAKSGDPALIAGYCGSSEALDEALCQFAQSYIQQTDRDYDSVALAVKSGRIAASVNG